MKYSQQIGIIAALCLLGSCYLPWAEIVSIHKIVTGVDGYVSEHFTFGKQIMLHSIFTIPAIIFFAIPKIWAKRTNMFFCLMNMAVAIKNYIGFSRCWMGDCPKVKFGLYIMLLASVLILVMSLLPKMVVKNK